MKNNFFQSIELQNKGTSFSLNDILDKLIFNDQGLITIITQDATSKDVLMLAWMNRESIEKTLTTGLMTYWSRSRQQFWVKGETSGHTQELVSMRIDCDGDALLCFVNQTGGACHTGRDNCFYFEVNKQDESVVILSSAP